MMESGFSTGQFVLFQSITFEFYCFLVMKTIESGIKQWELYSYNRVGLWYGSWKKQEN